MEEARTLIAEIGARASREPTAMAVWGQVDHEWRRLSWALYASSIRQAAKGLVRLELEPGDVVLMIGANRPEWAVAQHGALAAGARVAWLPPDVDDADLAARVGALKPRIVFVDTVDRLVRVDRHVGAAGLAVDGFVILDAVTGHDPRLFTLDDLMVHGASVQDEVVEARIRGLDPEPTALLLPQPEGGWRAIPHAELLALARAHADRASSADRVLSQLPPSELTEQVFAFALPALVGCPVWFVGRGEAVATWAEARPTLVVGDADSWRALAEQVRRGLDAADGVRGPLVRWAASTERIAQIEGRDGLGRRLARALVLDELRERMGLDALVAARTTEPVDDATRDVLASVGVALRVGPG